MKQKIFHWGRRMEQVEEQIRSALRTVIDPEIGLDIVDIGLVYSIDTGQDTVRIVMTLTTPACPTGDYLLEQAQEAARAAVFPRDVRVELVWDPPWTPERMSENARDLLGW